MKDGGPALPSASEIRFHEYYSLVDDIEALFNDVLHTTIADGTTEEVKGNQSLEEVFMELIEDFK